MRIYEIGRNETEATAGTEGRDRRIRPEPWIAVLLSVLMPGLGHGYCQMWFRGLTFLMLATGFTVLGLVSAWANFAGMTFLSSVGAVFYVLCVLDAYRCSRTTRAGRAPWFSGSRVAFLFSTALVLFMGAFFMVVSGTMAVHFVGQAITVVSGAMRPSLEPGDKVLANRQVRSWADLHSGDLVVIGAGADASAPVVRRVIARPGQRVRMERGQVWVDGLALTEPYASYRSDVSASPGHSRVVFFPELTVPAGSLFVLADVRDMGEDSREWGPVEEGRVLGRVDFLFYPPTRHRQFADSYLSKLTHRLMAVVGL